MRSGTTSHVMKSPPEKSNTSANKPAVLIRMVRKVIPPVGQKMQIYSRGEQIEAPTFDEKS